MSFSQFSTFKLCSAKVGVTLGFGVLAITSAQPAEAAVIQCAGSSAFGSITTGSGANCGFLGVGDTFRIDVTPFFSGLNSHDFKTTPFGIGVVTSGGTTVAFQNLSAVVTGIAGGQQFTVDKPAIFGLDPDQPFGSALNAAFTYTANTPGGTLGAFRNVNFAFGSEGPGGFGSRKASPNFVGLTHVDQFEIVGTFASVGNKFVDNRVSFGVGPAGIPTAGSTFGGNFTTEVPGPLPIAGAGAAFAWSRKLRRKQKLAAMTSSSD